MVHSAPAACPQQDPRARNNPSNPTHTNAYRRAEPHPTLTNEIWKSTLIRGILNTSGRGIPTAAAAARQTEPHPVQGHTAPSAESWLWKHSCSLSLDTATPLPYRNHPLSATKVLQIKGCPRLLTIEKWQVGLHQQLNEVWLQVGDLRQRWNSTMSSSAAAASSAQHMAFSLIKTTFLSVCIWCLLWEEF